MEMFVKRALTDEMYHDTVIIGTENYLSYVYQALLYFDQHPSLKLRKKLCLSRLFVKMNKLTFINLNDYLPADSIKDVPKSSDEVFFPMAINYKDFYQMTDLPAFEYFCMVTDTEDILELKRQFHATSSKNWNFQFAMTEFLLFRVNQIITVSLEVMNFAKNFQRFLKEKLDKNEMSTMSPFSAMTLTKFFYILITNYNLEGRADMYAVAHAEKGMIYMKFV